MKVCVRPFTAIEIYDNGDVYTCCPAFFKASNESVCGRIGNIFENSVDEIWNSEEAVSLRKSILEGDYSKCNLALCRQRKLLDTSQFDATLRPSLPVEITFAYDKECNLACITCRDERYQNSKVETELLNSKIDSVILPFLSNAKRIAVSGSGEVFASSHSKFLIKEINQKYPDVKFLINTNGILCNRENVEELGLKDKINEVFVSLPALNEKVYKSIVIGGNLNLVLKNIKWLSEERKKGKIRIVTISLVVSALNYKEIPKLVDFAKKLGIHISVNQYCNWGTKLGERYKELAVWDKNNPEYNKFIKILKHKALSYEKCFLQPLFKDLREK